MNYQLLIEYHVSGTEITELEAKLLDLELYSQIESIKVSSSQGCLKVAPDHICNASHVRKGSLWITCLAALLDQLSPTALGVKARGALVFDELARKGYIGSD